jgi:SAM-dependent methyltransferase
MCGEVALGGGVERIGVPFDCRAAVRRAFHPLWRRAPALRTFVLEAIELAARPLFLPFRLDRPRAPQSRAAAERDTDAFNAAAERYFAAHADEAHLLDKPFSEPSSLSRRLIDAGVLIDSLRLQPGDTVLELGAGSCWLSHLLNRFGCRTVAVDVSPSALAIGRRVFERDPRTNWTLDPQFLVYDGHTLPARDASVDHVVLYDAYHHLPNPEPLLREMRRVLRPEGIVGMSEPGRGHSESGSSRSEAATGVLENELVVEDIAELAIRCGFTAAHVVVAANAPLLEIDARRLRPFMGGRGFAQYWKSLCAALDGHHYLLLFAGDPVPTTRRPKRLNAVIRPLARTPIAIDVRRPAELVVELHNGGDTRWLHTASERGWTRLGAHLHRADPQRTLVDFDWLRMELPGNVEPNQTIRVRVPLPAPAPGDYIAVFDLVVEGMAWFAERGSVSVDVPLHVR